MKRTSVKKLFGSAIKIIIAATVFVFLGMKSIDFFLFTTPADKWFYAYLGFGLTGGGVIAYLVIFLWDADSALKKMVAIVMLGVCIIGELATAGFGLQIDTWEKTGISMLDSDFQAMVLAVQLLGFAHAAALVAYVAGDKIAEALGDDDGDGIPNVIDKDYIGKQVGFVPKQASTVLAELVEAQAEIARLKASVDAPKV